MNPNDQKPTLENGSPPNWLEIVRKQVESLRFGVVEIVVHESRVVQIEKTERVRLEKRETDPKAGRTTGPGEKPDKRPQHYFGQGEVRVRPE